MCGGAEWEPPCCPLRPIARQVQADCQPPSKPSANGTSGSTVSVSEPIWDAFISYRRRDGTPLARYVRRRLLRFRLPRTVLARIDPAARAMHARGPRIWLDTAYERPSDDFLTHKVFPALDGAERLIVLCTPMALEPLVSPAGPQPNWLEREVTRFIDRDRHRTDARPIDVVLGPGATEDRFPVPLNERPRLDWIDLRAFHRHRWNPLDESRDAAIAKLVAGLYSVSEEDLPVLQRAERRQRMLWLMVGMILAIIVAVAMIMLAGYAESQRQNAVEQRDLAIARLLASEGYRVSEANSHRAKAYFLNSLALVETPNAVSGLVSLVQKDPHASMRFLPLANEASAIHTRDDGRVVVGMADGSVLLWSIAGDASVAGEQTLAGAPAPTRLIGLGERIIALAQPQFRILAIDGQGRLIEWAESGTAPKVLAQLASGAEIAQRVYDKSYEAAIAENGSTAVIPTYRGVVVWTATAGVTRLLRPEMAGGGPVALSADGRKLAYAIGGALSRSVPLRIIELGDVSGSEVDVPPLPQGSGAVLSAAFARDGKTLAAGTQNGFVQIWQIGDKPRPFRLLEHSVVPSPGSYEVVEHVFVGPDSRSLVSRFGGAWQVWDIPTSTPLGSPQVTTSPIAAFAATRQTLLTINQQTVVAHDYSVTHLRAVACLSGVRDLTNEEWTEIAGDTPRVSPCAQ